MSDGLALRLRLALGRTVQLGDEQPATGGVRIFEARLPGATGAVTHRLVLAPPPPDGPSPLGWEERGAALRGAGHPALASILSTGTFEDRGWWVEGALPSPHLAERLHERGPASVRETIATLRETARLLVALHRRGIAHGAVHPDAIHIASTGRVLLANGFDAATPEDDLEALGRLGVAMLSGGRNGADQSALPNDPPELRRLIERLLDPDPRRRLARAEEVLAVLDAFPTRHASPLEALFEGAGRGARTAERHPALLVVSLAALGVLFYVLLAQAR